MMNRMNRAAMCLLLAAALCTFGMSRGTEAAAAEETSAAVEETVNEAGETAETEEHGDTEGAKDTDAEDAAGTEAEEIEDLEEEDLTAEEEEDPGISFEESGLGEEDVPEITVAEYDPTDYVKLGGYTGLDVEQLITEITDEDVDMEIESRLEEDSTETEVTDGAAEDDYVSFTYKLECEGETIEDSEGEEVEITLGLTELGEGIDQALIGAKPGDELTVTEKLEDYYDEAYEGKEGTYTLNVSRVYRYTMPELTDEYVKENTEYDTVDAWKEALKVSMQADADMYSRYDAGEAALGLAVENAEISGYPEDLYEKVYNDITAQYAYFFGDDFSSFIAEEDLAEAAKQEVYSEMVLKAIIEKEGLAMTEEQYQEYLKENLNSFGVSYETPEELAEAGGEDLRVTAEREIVCGWLLDHDNIIRMSQEEYDAKYGAEEGLEIDMDETGDEESVIDGEEEEAEAVEETPAVEEGGAE